MKCLDCRGAGSTFRWWGLTLHHSTWTALLFLRLASGHVRGDGIRVVFEPLWFPLAGFFSVSCRPCNGWGSGEPMPPIDMKRGPCPLCRTGIDWALVGEGTSAGKSKEIVP